MATQQHGQQQGQQQLPLRPFPITLSMLHLKAPMSALPKMSGVEMILPESDLRGPTKFMAIVIESSSSCVLLESFYNSHISGRTFEGIDYPMMPLATLGISRVAFATMLGQWLEQDPLHDPTAPEFNVKGVCKPTLSHQGYEFEPSCFVLDHIFELREFESKFVAVFGLDFLSEYFISAQWTEGGNVLVMPPVPPSLLGDLQIYTDGCCLSNGQQEGKPARAGYGIHFPQLSREWNIGNPLSQEEKHTN